MNKLGENQKVFGIGLSRTGTTSLGEALNLLGIKTIHFPHDEQTYAELRAGNYQLSILKMYQGIVDTPVAPYYAQLDRIYPGSKFILTVREEDSWLRSVEYHWRLMEWRLARDSQRKEFVEFLHASVYGCIEFNEERFTYVYNSHLRNVCHYFAQRPRDLLVMNVIDNDGWEKLGPFLGLSIPNVPFPHLNPTGEQEKKTREREKTMQRLDRATEGMEAVIPPGETFVLVDHATFGQEVSPKLRPVPFPERDGQYWGLPANDEEAIQELERLRGTGASFIVFLWPAFWWLDYYTGLHHFLRLKFPCVLENESLVIFDLNP